MEYATYWVGVGGDESTFRSLLEYSMGEEGLGEFQPCRFCAAIGVSTYEPEYLQGKFWGQPLRLPLILHGEPLRQSILDAAPDIDGANCRVVLIGPRPEFNRSEFNLDGISFHCLGSFEWTGLQVR